MVYLLSLHQILAKHEEYELMSYFQKNIVVLQRFLATYWAENVRNKQPESDA